MSDLRVREIGEFDLIARLIAALPAEARGSDRLVLATGDDAAAAVVTPGELIVVTADTLNDGVHFRTDWTRWDDLGHKAIAVNPSDLAAMGARPLVATVSLSLTGDERLSDLEAMYGGLGRCAAASGWVVAGGDITRTPGPLAIAITAIGETIDGRLLRRDAAQAGDLIWVTGSIGAASAGLALQMLPETDPRRQATTAPVLIEALHRPIPRTAAGQMLAKLGVRCAMDLSDGLSGDLRKILVASGVDAEIVIDTLPIPAAVRALFRDDAIDLALHGGDDYELLFTAPESMNETIRTGLAETGVEATMIGRVLERAGEAPALWGLYPDGTVVTIAPRSFDHFKSD